MIVIRLIKRLIVVVPVLLLAVTGVLIALLLWILFGSGDGYTKVVERG